MYQLYRAEPNSATYHATKTMVKMNMKNLQWIHLQSLLQVAQEKDLG